MLDILIVFVFPLVLVGLILIIFLTSIPHRRSTKDFMSYDEFIKDWLKDHDQAHKVEEQFNKMKKDPSGKLYMPITYKGAIIFLRWGLTPNKVSWLNLILSFLIFYGAIMAGLGHSYDWLSVQPFYGVWMFLVGVLIGLRYLVKEMSLNYNA